MKQSFNEKIALWNYHKKFLQVGLDITFAHIPENFQKLKDPQTRHLHFICHIIDITANCCNGWKPNLKFYEGSKGRERLEQVCDYIQWRYPNHIITGDNKDGDIGNTNDQALKYYVEDLKLDAFTLNPLMGYEDGCSRYLSNPNIGVFALCLTSNKGAENLLKEVWKYTSMYERIAEYSREEETWNKNKNYNLVVGATNDPSEILKIRGSAGDDVIFLMPGFGAQGGDIKSAIQAAKNKKGEGFLGVVARDIIQPKIEGGETYEDAVYRRAEFYQYRFVEAAVS